MAKKHHRAKVSFIAKKKISKPVKIEFYTKEGKKVFFKGYKQVTKPVRVEFYAKKAKKK